LLSFSTVSVIKNRRSITNMSTKYTFRLILAWLLCGWFALSKAEAEFEVIQCRQSQAVLAAPDSADYRKYAPSREIDIMHLAIDVTPDFKQRTIAGKVTLKFKPIAKPIQELRLDAVDLNVSSAASTTRITAWQATDKNVIITFAQPIPPDQEASVTIDYTAEPSKGLYFRTPEMGYKPEDTHLWTQGESIEARHWYPCYDAPNEKFTSEVTCRVPEGMVVLSNGKRVSEEKDSGSGLVAVRWLQDKPHVNYLISLLAGHFKKVEDNYKDIPLAFYVPASQIDQAVHSFKDTKDIMGFFEQEIGVPYPWAKYYQVCVDDFTAGGMENTSITTLTDRTLHTTATENLRDSRGLVAHELAHQWFGDLVTCKDWSHVWLNEGFATYYDHLYDGYKNGRDALLYDLYESAKHIVSQTNDTKSIVNKKYNDPQEQFSYLAYPKGGWVLNMLRNQLGEELYRRCIKTYLERHQFGNVVTEDLSAVIEELSGRSYDQFFDQWVYHARQPELAVNYNWDEKNKLAKLSIAQTQRLSDDVVLFNFPLTIRFKSKTGTVDRQITIKEKAEDFYFPLNEAPETVRIDPEVSVLAKTTFTPPAAMLHAQLADKTDMVGRLIAVELLGAKADRQSITKLKEALNADSFYGVRLAASRAMRSIHTDEALQALQASTKQTDARVRQQVTQDIAGFYRDSSFETLQKVLQEEKNPDIVAAAISGLGAYPKPAVREKLLQYLNSDSYRNTLADAAVNAIRAQDDASYLDPLRECLQKKEGAFTTGAFSRGLSTMAYLARNEEKKDAIRDFLTGYINHRKQTVQLAVIAALGTLGDPKGMAVLEKFTGASKETPERAAAERALAALRDAKRPSAELGTLRSELLTLQKENRDLRKEFDDLKKKIDAATPKAGSGKAGKSPAATKTSKP
jgi:aminopeptidase N